jgi:small subunit ribosomal protein S17
MTKETKKIESTPKKRQFRELKGIVVSNKMEKTVVVKVDTIKRHKIYKKSYTVSKRYKAHDAINQYKVNDMVLLRQIKPMSKDKKWEVIKKIK